MNNERIPDRKKSFITKYIAILSILIVLKLPAFSQIVNGDFQTWTFTGTTGDCSPSTDGQTGPRAPFQGCYLYDPSMAWNASHGTPEIWEQLNGSRYALLWSGQFNLNNGVRSEGIWQRCYFKKGKIYTLRYFLGCDNSTLDHVYVYLANGILINNTIDYDTWVPLYDVPNISNANKQLIHEHINVPVGSYQTYVWTFMADKDYNCIWFYPYSTATAQALLYLDDISIDDCDDFKVYQNNSSLPYLTLVSDYILAFNNVNVLNGQDVTFNAGNEITLGSGFTAQNGSIFNAFIQGCAKLDCMNAHFRIGNPDTSTDSSVFMPNATVFYPNPVKSTTSLSYFIDSKSTGFIEIYSMSGSLILKKQLSPDINTFSISADNFYAGIYLYHIIINGAVILKDKLIVLK